MKSNLKSDMKNNMKSNTVELAPNMLKWARERADYSIDMLTKSFPKIEEWEKGELQPTLKQLENFAKKVHIPIGYLFLPSPLEEAMPISDFRTISTHAVKFSVNLLDTIYLCQQRQDWYRDYARIQSMPELAYVGSVDINSNIRLVAQTIRNLLAFSLEEQMQASNYEEMLRLLRNKVEDLGILLMINGKVGSNTRRTLSIEEFRGFALSDKLAPLIFINGKDSKAGQIFTLAHELAHIFLGESGVSDVHTGLVPTKDTELWCNKVAAEFLVPMEKMQEIYNPNLNFEEQIDILANKFKVSSFVILRRFYDAGYIDNSTLWQHYQLRLAKIRSSKQSGGGGDFYKSFTVQTSKRFAEAIITSTLEGNTLFRDSMRLLGVKKTDVIYNTARQLGVLHKYLPS